MAIISKLLATTGAVTGKGEKIEKRQARAAVEKVDVVTQVDSVTLEYEIHSAANNWCEPSRLAQQLINKLENHQRSLLVRETKFGPSFDNKFYAELDSIQRD